MSGATAAAAIAAAKRAEKLRKEEETLATYDSKDLEGWEFKIIRSGTEYFRKPENLKKMCDEEAQAGWEMVEKFDNTRVRFKRRIEERKNDQFRTGIDPYRTTIGIGSGGIVAIVLGIVAVFIGVIFAIGIGKRGAEISGGLIPVIIVAIALIAVLALVVMKAKRGRSV